jgi:hypothetical protein
MIRMTKPRRMRWAWERREMYTGFWRETKKERDHWEDLHAGERIILKRS